MKYPMTDPGDNCIFSYMNGSLLWDQMSNKKKGCLGYIWGIIQPSYIGIIIRHYIRIPINQPGFNEK